MKPYKTAITAATLFLMGCSSDIKISGEAFLDTPNGANKLSLVSIKIVPEDKLQSYIKQQLPSLEQKAEKLAQSARERLAREEEAVALRAQGAALRGLAQLYPGVMGAAIENARVSRESEILSAQALAQIEKDVNEIKGLKSGASATIFSSPIEGVIAATETDSEGKYKITVKPGKNYILIATKEDKAWALRINPEKGEMKISLTNQNLSGTGCAECVFGGKNTPKTFAESQNPTTQK